MSDSHADPDALGEPSVEVARLERRAVRERTARKEAERLLEAKSRELWEERERYRVLVENSSDVVATADMAGVITWISDSVTAMLGWAAHELVGTSIASLLHPDDLQTYLDLRPNRERGEDLRYEARMRTSHGAWPWVSIQSRQIFDDRGNPSHRVAGWRDVTAEREAAGRLEASEERLRATLDAMLDPHVVLEAVRHDTGRIVDFVFVDANAAAAEFNGLSRDDLIGVLLLGQHPAAGTTTLFEDYVRVVETGEPIIRDDWSYPQDMLGGELRRYDVRAVKFRDGLSQTWRDVTDRYEASRRIAESEERYRLLADNATDIIFRLRHSLITWVSPSVSTVLGGAPHDWIGQNWADLIHPDDMDAAAAALPDLLETGTGLYRARIRAFDGAYHWAEAHIGTYVRSTGEADGWIVSTRIIDEQVAAEQKLERLARLDALTGAVNRGEAMTRLRAIIANERRPGRELAVIFCDVDRFKEINDTFGHAAGDAVLVELARRIADNIRRDDLVARMGGDEILVLLGDTHGRDEALQIAEKIRMRVAEPIVFDRQVLSVTLSIGVSVLIPGEDPDALIARADEAMYEAKRLGRNRVIAI